MKNRLVFFVLILLFLYSSCKESEAPTVTAEGVVNITGYSAYCEANVTSEGSAPVQNMGFHWSTEETSTLGGQTNMAGKKGAFGRQINELEPYTTYFVQAYATNKYGTAYSNEIEFKTGAYTAACNPPLNKIETSTGTFDINSARSHGGEINIDGVDGNFKVRFAEVPESGVYTTTKSSNLGPKECNFDAFIRDGLMHYWHTAKEGHTLYLTKTGEGQYTGIFCNIHLMRSQTPVIWSGHFTVK